MSFWLDDLDNFFKDFSVELTLVNYPSSSSGASSGATVNTIVKCLFDEAQNVVDIQTGQIVSAKPQASCKSSDVSAILRRSQVIINGVTYLVNDILDDGTGITILQLST